MNYPVRVFWYETDEDKVKLLRRRLDRDEIYREAMRYEDPPDTTKVCKGHLLEVAYQPEQWVGGKGIERFIKERAVAAQWKALVRRDDTGRIVEMDPKDLHTPQRKAPPDGAA